MRHEDYPKVILIGGAPLSGKTTLSRKLASLLERQCLSTDDLGRAIAAVTSSDSHPGLHPHPLAETDYCEYCISHSVPELVEHYQRQHVAMWPGVAAVIQAHAIWDCPIIIEGWVLLPEWISQLEYANAKALWLVADDEVLKARLVADTDFYGNSSNPELMIRHFHERSLHYNADLKRDLDRLHMPFIKISPKLCIDDIVQLALEKLQLV
jgi:2-phosphoglycerate kinase